MDKLEQYLDQVCRGIGPRSLRQHIRQELNEHLRDAMAQHKAAGLTEQAALERALADFGGSEQLHSELIATHGERMMQVIIDKALAWKERTMRAKWLWMTWSYFAALGVVAIGILSLCFFNCCLVPKLKKFEADGWLQNRDLPVLDRLKSILHALDWAGEYFIWLLAGAAVLWGLFEWRVRSENKAFMRLAALGTGGLGLTAVVFLAAVAIIIPFVVGLPSAKIVRPFASQEVANVDSSISALEKAHEKNDWGAMEDHVHHALQALARLESGSTLRALATGNEPTANRDLQLHCAAAKDALLDLQHAIQNKQADLVAPLLKRFHQVFDLIQQAAKKSNDQ
jgi:hypothetical protein